MGVPERMLHEDGAQRVFEHGVFENYAWQRGETNAGADGVRDRDCHRSEAKYYPRRDVDVTLRACKGPGVPIGNHYTVVLDEILGRLRNTITLQIFPGGRDDERHRSQGTSNQPGRRRVCRSAYRKIIALLPEVYEPIFE